MTAFDVVFGVFVVATLVLIVLVLRFTFQRAALARRRWLAQQGRSDDAADAASDGDEDDGEDAEDGPLVALVLAGGGTRGAVQIGMLQVLAEHGFVPDRIYGTSVGAVNGAGFAADPTPQGVERMARIWTALDREDVYPQGRLHGPWMYFQQRDAVYSNSGLRRIVEEGVSFERLEEATVPFEVVATSLLDGRERWFTYGPAVEAILASAALPAIFPPVEIEGERYIDGGVVNNVPIRRAIDAGATRIVVLMCSPPTFEPSRARRPIEAVLNALFIAVHARFARDMAQLPPDVEIVLCAPGAAEDGGRGFGDFSSTPELIAEGRREASEVVRRYGLGRAGAGSTAVGSSGPTGPHEPTRVRLPTPLPVPEAPGSPGTSVVADSADSADSADPATDDGDEPVVVPAISAEGDTETEGSDGPPASDEPAERRSTVFTIGRRVVLASRRRVRGIRSNGRAGPENGKPADPSPDGRPASTSTNGAPPTGARSLSSDGDRLAPSTQPDPGT